MLSQRSRPSKLAFGFFEFDPGSGELFRHGSRVRLASQPGKVLNALVDRPGEIVTREYLRERLWPGVASGDFEHGLNAAMNKLRQTLGDVADQPHYVETLPGIGYRFVAPVHPAGGAVLESTDKAIGLSGDIRSLPRCAFRRIYGPGGSTSFQARDTRTLTTR